ncbi:hypothetical protein LOK49_Contig78G00009 [Camellia lanceoleosa]|nr:hypothetical protein LOK49_Contig78G00009 [Camellia lanceoleosa]
MAAILARKSLFALRSRHLALAGQTLHNPNHGGMALATRSFATKQSFSSIKDEDVVGRVWGRKPIPVPLPRRGGATYLGLLRRFLRIGVLCLNEA